jgi:hypothetical protein
MSGLRVAHQRQATELLRKRGLAAAGGGADAGEEE